MRSILLFSVVFLFCYCGGRNIRPLNSGEAARLRNSFDRLGMAMRSVTPAFNDPEAVEVWGAKIRTEDSEALKDKLRASMAAGDCIRQREGSLSQGVSTSHDIYDFWGETSRSVNASLSGDKCPVEARFSISHGVDAGHYSVTAHYYFKMKDVDFKALSDIDEGEFKLEAQFTRSESGAAVTISGKVDLNGKLHSQSEGQFSAFLTGEGNITGGKQWPAKDISGRAQVEFGFEFDEFTGDLKATIEKAPGTHDVLKSYEVNNSLVSESEFRDYIKNITWDIGR